MLNMKEPDLHKYFSGGFSLEEKKYLKEYFEKNPNYFEQFQRERKLYNLALFHPETVTHAKTNFQINIDQKRLLWAISKTAIIFLLAYISFYFLNNNTNNSSNQVAYQTISVPFGQRVNIDLPDGSKVCLNAGSIIKYPISFNHKSRQVYLTGEAYFDVHRDESLPFCVIAGNHKIEVLGTKFNVVTDSICNKFETTLFEGSVSIIDFSRPNQTVLLKPNSQAVHKDGELKVQAIANLDRYYWRDGILAFNKDSFKEIMSVFEKSYGFKIKVENKDVNKYLYTGKFIQTDGIDYALRLLQESIHFSYYREKDTNTIIIE